MHVRAGRERVESDRGDRDSFRASAPGLPPGEAGIAFIPPCSPMCHLVPESVPLLANFFFFKKVSAVIVKLLLVARNSRHHEGF